MFVEEISEFLSKSNFSGFVFSPHLKTFWILYIFTFSHILWFLWKSQNKIQNAFLWRNEKYNLLKISNVLFCSSSFIFVLWVIRWWRKLKMTRNLLILQSKNVYFSPISFALIVRRAFDERFKMATFFHLFFSLHKSKVKLFLSQYSIYTIKCFKTSV